MDAPDFIAVYRVVQPIVKPILALPGMVLTVWPRSQTHTLAVCKIAPGYPVIRHAYMDPGALYGVVMAWEDFGFIAALQPELALRRIA